MQQTAMVIGIEGDMVLVRGERASACGSCAGHAACGTLGSWNSRSVELRIRNEIGAEVGDEVLLDVPDRLMLAVAFRLYGLPMVAFFLAGLAAYRFAVMLGAASPDLWAAVAAVGGVAVTYLLFWRRSQQGREPAIDVHMVRICSRSGAAQKA